VSPRIFADAFFNSKDIPFLAVFIINIHTMMRLFDRPTWSRALCHALVSGILIAIRVLGLLIPCLTVFWMCGMSVFDTPRGVAKTTRHALSLRVGL